MQSSYTYAISLEKDTAHLAKAMAVGVKKTSVKAILLYGDLGLGKTALASFFTRNFPGGEVAETSSPSFTVCNIYSTFPEIYHYDLYRLPPYTMEDSLEEAFETEKLCIIEWAERIKKTDLPNNALSCKLYMDENNNRLAEISFHGSEGKKAFDIVVSFLSLDKE